MTNKFKGTCVNCSAPVPAQAGEAFKQDSKWAVRHIDCALAAAEAPTPFTAVEGGTVPPTKTTFAPTAEQQECLDLFSTGESMVIEALAGTGKTSTLKLLAESTDRKGQYLAFNKAIVAEATTKFPANVQCNTAHSLAYRSAVGSTVKGRLNGKRQPSEQTAAILHIPSYTFKLDEFGDRKLHSSYLAGLVLTAVSNFCKSADIDIERRHFSYVDGIDNPTEDGRRTYTNNDDLAAFLLPYARKAWTDLSSKDGSLRFGFDHLLKLWQLSNPRIEAEFILFDEAQDANPVMAAVVAAQEHAQVVYVGDSQQAIYEFTGAVNTLANLDTDHRKFLTQSFRFGPAIGDVANIVLDKLDADSRVVGTPSIPSTVGLSETDNAILCRTNATAVSTVLTLQEKGRRPHLVGGGREVVDFTKAARDLQVKGSTSHPELACFRSWDEVQIYVLTDAQGAELRLLVNLVDKFGIQTILGALDNMPTEENADVVVSTAHKAKGREWDNVSLAGDFLARDEETGELKEVAQAEQRLLYVAVTRARKNLDIHEVSAYFEADTNDIEDLGDEVNDDVTRWVDGLED